VTDRHPYSLALDLMVAITRRRQVLDAKPRSGKTTDLLRTALDHVAAGENISVLVSMTSVDAYIACLKVLLNERSDKGRWRFSGGGLTLTHIDRNRYLFLSSANRDQTRPAPSNTILVDHYAESQKLERAAQHLSKVIAELQPLREVTDGPYS